ncbi:adhesin [Methanobrevibacter sp.]|uniref:adhesin n=1 Tax=Methanobrevibacter sp. TaxID=66852 RepID=UPI00388D705F
MNFKYIFIISIILLTLSLSAVSAENIASDNGTDIVSGDLNSNDIISTNIINEASLIQEKSSEGSDVVENTSNSSIESSDLVKYYKNDSQYEATFYDAESNPLVNQLIPIEINGQSYNRTTNSSGTMKFSINLNPGDYVIKVTNPVTSEIALNNVTVLPTLISRDVVKYYKNGTQYYILALDGQGNPLANDGVQLNINGVFYNRTTNQNGIARLNINLNPGNYVITAIGSNGLQISNNITVLSTIRGENIKKMYRNGTQYYANFTDNKGNPLANTNVTFNINGVFYNRKTNENGTAKLNINLNAGKYILTAINPVTTEQMSNTVEVLSKIVVKNSQKEGNISIEYNSGSKYTVTLYNDDGSLAKNKDVKFNINGVLYNRKSNENGTASLNINLQPGDYIITADFEGCKVSNLINVRITPAIKLESYEVKYLNPIKFYLTEKNSGNPITGNHYGYCVLNETHQARNFPDQNGLVTIGQDFPVGFNGLFMFGVVDDGYYSELWVMNTIRIVE